MANSSLYHSQETPPTVNKGHGTAALGPSDSTDSGSDIQGGSGLNRDDGLMSPTGTTSDPDFDGAGATAGADIGDANLDSDSDRTGTGERGAAGRDSTVATDQQLRDIETDELIDPESLGDDVVSAGSDVVREQASDSGADNEPRTRDHTRAEGRHPPNGDDIPVFERGGREDMPNRGLDDGSRSRPE